MGKRAELFIKESQSELLALKQSSKNSYSKNRLQALLLIKTESFKTRKEVALAIGIHKRTLEHWTKEYTQYGINSYIKDSRGGSRKSCMSKESHQRLEQKVNDSKQPFLGYKDALLWFRENISEDMKYNTLRTYLIRHFGTKLKTPRKSHYKKDEQAIEAFKKTS